jgi:hypothetical protein
MTGRSTALEPAVLSEAHVNFMKQQGFGDPNPAAKVAITGARG